MTIVTKLIDPVEFKITSKVRLLPPNITKEGLINFSLLKNKKRWKHNRRLRKKFLKNFYKYLPHWVICEWANIPIYTKAMNEIMYEEDRRLLQSI